MASHAHQATHLDGVQVSCVHIAPVRAVRPDTASEAPMTADDVLQRLAATITARRAESSGKSYTRQLLDAGPERCAKKLGEEAVETVIAAVHQDDKALTAEAADLLYHLLVVLEVRNVPLASVMAVLEGRMAQSGLAEKASRQVKG